ncbi:hypothetical protein GJU39_20220 [Pedobacter petrophilus]|uniref:SPOR domain-containing protein n=1 Tax=Pedobacter petrophilus TaxID=1908241 RepID=A0A7K0G3X7_9SPHI|nr:SPOR domain-containing protein [Pedobacter petrophilus]MRX78411.1 hypothetical protein [Pedobacter petrophilus]
MDISSFLFELLQQHKEVGITGLGTFYKKKYPGRYDKEKQSFLPPGFTLLFSHDVKEENILPVYISEKRNISIESANDHITQFVEETTETLAQENEAVLSSIGRLYFTEHEGLSFEPAQNINYGSEFFGLPALVETSVVEGEINALQNDEPETFDEIAEAPGVPNGNINREAKEVKHPEIENIELDEVNDDFKNTLKHTLPADQVTDAPAFIKEQHTDHPNRFGHTPEDEEAVKAITDAEALSANSNEEINEIEEDLKADEPVIEAPEFIKEQHADHPNRFGHTPEDEEAVKAITDTEALSPNSNEEINTVEEDLKADETVIEAPEFIKEQHADHPNRFGHTPEDEEAVKAITDTEALSANSNEEINEVEEDLKADEPVIEAPEFIKEQHADHPNRFGNPSASEEENIPADLHKPESPAITTPGPIESVITHQENPNRFRFGYTPETDEPKTYVNLEEEAKTEEPVIEAPEFIQAQHAAHPNRFGHDPIIPEEETPQGMSTWLKVTIVVLILVIIAAITYLVKPELFTGQSASIEVASRVIDSPKVAVDTLKAKQDSTAKTDSILKVNQVQKKADSAQKPVVKPVVETPKETKVTPNTGGPSTFDVIAASFQSEKKALVFIKQMEKLGFKAKIANLPGRLKKVSVASFKTQKEAEEQKEIIQKKLKGKGFFVQRILNNTQP